MVFGFCVLTEKKTFPFVGCLGSIGCEYLKKINQLVTVWLANIYIRFICETWDCTFFFKQKYQINGQRADALETATSLHKMQVTKKKCVENLFLFWLPPQSTQPLKLILKAKNSRCDHFAEHEWGIVCAQSSLCRYSFLSAICMMLLLLPVNKQGLFKSLVRCNENVVLVFCACSSN